MDTMSPLAMAEWIEILKDEVVPEYIKSPLAMAEWIEMLKATFANSVQAVSASDGGVD